MKCPYQTKVIHRPEYVEGYVKHFAEDITMFAECLKSECPFYRYHDVGGITEKCLRAEKERKC